MKHRTSAVMEPTSPAPWHRLPTMALAQPRPAHACPFPPYGPQNRPFATKAPLAPTPRIIPENIDPQGILASFKNPMLKNYRPARTIRIFLMYPPPSQRYGRASVTPSPTCFHPRGDLWAPWKNTTFRSL